jgi:hypothetical protein
MPHINSHGVSAFKSTYANIGCLHMISSDVYNFPPPPSRILLQGADDFLCSINSSKHLTTMRVLLLGATGNLGSRCLAALVAHKHVVTVFVRNSSKLRAMMSPALLAEANAIVEGGATDSTALKKAILDHDINRRSRKHSTALEGVPASQNRHCCEGRSCCSWEAEREAVESMDHVPSGDSGVSRDQLSHSRLV